MAAVRLTVRARGPRIAAGGTVSYVLVRDGRPVGMVYDERAWSGSRFGARFWRATWREETDRAARWTSDGHRSRTAAVAALAARIGETS